MMFEKLKNIVGSASHKEALLTLGGVALARAQEPLHLLLAGSTGTGKTTGVVELMLGLAQRGDRMIVTDPNGFYLSRFYKPGDVILNPFDKRSPGWSPFAEVRKPYDFDKVARSIVPDGHGADAAWHFYSQVLIAEVMRALMSQGETTTVALIEALTVWPADRLAALVAGTAVAGLFDKDAARALASTRFILSSYLKPYQYLQAGDFSLRKWLEGDGGNLYLTWREDMTSSLAPLIACWVDVLCTATLSLAPDPQRRLWLLLDELASLGKIGALEAALTKGRKHGLCCVAGLQSTAQLDRVYGKESAIVLRSCFRNFCAFAVAKIDPDTSEVFSRALGEQELDRAVKSESRSAQGNSQSVSMQRVRERLVLPSQIAELPDLHAYLALAGHEPTRQVQLRPVVLPAVAHAIYE
ncbi:MAG: type IV secretion system DNA-binding domain-containing protein [Candidatus Saccharibacteria bacterium]|nr:type IV secretion system DNA-binding domain-containing protein [Rhodoferax sp.]